METYPGPDIACFMSVILLEENISVDPMKTLEGECYVLIKAYKFIILRYILYYRICVFALSLPCSHGLGMRLTVSLHRESPPLW